ncbi:hypothetical protein HKX48_003751, partial [Thoreauomyces humboldtii]
TLAPVTTVVPVVVATSTVVPVVVATSTVSAVTSAAPVSSPSSPAQQQGGQQQGGQQQGGQQQGNGSAAGPTPTAVQKTGRRAYVNGQYYARA